MVVFAAETGPVEHAVPSVAAFSPWSHHCRILAGHLGLDWLEVCAVSLLSCWQDHRLTSLKLLLARYGRQLQWLRLVLWCPYHLATALAGRTVGTLNSAGETLGLEWGRFLGHRVGCVRMVVTK